MMKLLLFVALMALAAVAGNASRTQVVRIHEVTRKQYNELLRLTQGQTKVSEARLLRSSLSSYLPSFLNDGGSKPSSSTSLKDYPLCVVSPNRNDNGYRGRHATWNFVNQGEEEADENEGQYDGGYGSVIKGGQGNRNQPVVNCIVVVKDNKYDSDDDGNVISPKPKPKPIPSYPLVPPMGTPPWAWYGGAPNWYWQAPHCDPLKDPNCRCDPRKDRNCRCDPEKDPGCKCNPAKDPNCKCDPATDADCFCDPTDPSCKKCDPTDPSCK